MKTFTLNDKETETLNGWIKKKEEVYTGAIGGRYEYRFFPTSVGCVIRVKDCVDNEEIDITDYESW